MGVGGILKHGSFAKCILTVFLRFSYIWLLEHPEAEGGCCLEHTDFIRLYFAQQTGLA